LRLFSFGGYGLALAALALVVFGAVECPPRSPTFLMKNTPGYFWGYPQSNGDIQTASKIFREIFIPGSTWYSLTE